jgi:glycosyltransferase involved in cell wall biosynthesis
LRNGFNGCEKTNVKILYISGREPTYVRNAMILKGLKWTGFDVLENTDLSTSYPARYFKVLSKYILRNNKDIDLIFIGFFGQPLVPIIRKLTGKPIIFDAFLSAYDTMCFDRKKFKPNSPAGKFFFWLDKCSCESSDKILLDTAAHVDYFTHTFGLLGNKIQRIFVGADDSIFYPRDAERDDNCFRVFYYASYLPLHGTEHILQAAKILERNSEIEFVVVGKGPQHKKIRNLAQKIRVENINFVDWMPYENLPMEIAKANICLGGLFRNREERESSW